MLAACSTKSKGSRVKKAESRKPLRVHIGVRLPYSLHTDVVFYAVKHRLTVSEAIRRLLETSLKTSQRR